MLDMTFSATTTTTTVRRAYCLIFALAGFLLVNGNASGDTTVSVDTTQDGGSLVVVPPLLYVTDGSNDPTLTLTNGASANWSGSTIVGHLDGESGNLEIRNGSTLGNTGIGAIGPHGDHFLFYGSGYIGYNRGSHGRALVTGAGSRWNNSWQFAVGVYGTGELTISDGGVVTSDDSSYLGLGVGSSGTVLVTGADSHWNINRGLHIGYSASGDLTISDGGLVTSSGASLGDGYGSSGTVLVTGAGSRWNNSNGLSLGHPDSSATVTVSDGGLITTGTISTSLDNLHGNGTIRANGAVLDNDLTFSSASDFKKTFSFGSGGLLHLDINGAGGLGVGYEGSASLTITNGMVVNSDAGLLARHRGSHGVALVTGAGSEWNNTEGITIGFNGTGELTVSNGGVVRSQNSTLASGDIGQGTALVTGKDSWWDIRRNFIIGGLGKAKLTVSDGGVVTSLNAVIGSGGYMDHGHGTALVTGKNSRWEIGQNLTIGDRGTGYLTVSDGGLVISYSAGIGSGNGGQGRALVTGRDSRWVINQNLAIGNFETHTGYGNSLTVADNGLVIVVEMAIAEGGKIRLNGGYLAWLGDQRALVQNLLESGYIQVWNGLAWVDADGSPLFNSRYFSRSGDAADFTGYDDLGGYTILTSTYMVPEPATYGVLLSLGIFAWIAIRRRR